MIREGALIKMPLLARGAVRTLLSSCGELSHSLYRGH